MKYIRTKDGRIAEIKDNMIVKQSDVLRLVYKDKPYICVLCGNDEILKQADTIEELCDCFIGIYKDEEEIEDKEIAYFLSILADMKCFKEIYGAIWTDKGLIYVAKMNEKGELELL